MKLRGSVSQFCLSVVPCSCRGPESGDLVFVFFDYLICFDLVVPHGLVCISGFLSLVFPDF